MQQVGCSLSVVNTSRVWPGYLFCNARLFERHVWRGEEVGHRGKLNQIQIAIAYFRLIWHQIEFFLVLNRSENLLLQSKFGLITFLCVCFDQKLSFWDCENLIPRQICALLCVVFNGFLLLRPNLHSFLVESCWENVNYQNTKLYLAWNQNLFFFSFKQERIKAILENN